MCVLIVLEVLQSTEHYAYDLEMLCILNLYDLVKVLSYYEEATYR